jgi:hypothetical protein
MEGLGPYGDQLKKAARAPATELGNRIKQQPKQLAADEA